MATFVTGIVVMLSVLLSICLCYSDNKQTLQLVFTVFRHGDRTVELESIYPKDPYVNISYYPYGNGELINKGKKRAYELGKTLRNLYDSYLGPVYLPELIEAVSTDFSRTKCTLQLVLAGLFPPADTPLLWNNDLNWNPIPFNYVSMDKNRELSFPLYFCPKYQQLHEAYLQSPEALAIHNNYKQFYSYIAEHAGIKVTSIFDLAGLYFTLNTEETWGFTLPEWTKPVYPDYLKSAGEDMYRLLVATPGHNQLFGGFLLKKIINDIHQKINDNSQELKMHMYSAHDMTIVSLLSALNVYDPHYPDYNACILLELHKIQQKYYIKVRYNMETTHKFVDLKIPGCKYMCPIEKLLKLVQENIPADGDPCLIKET